MSNNYQSKLIYFSIYLNSTIGSLAVIVQAYAMGVIVESINKDVNYVLSLFGLILATMVVEIVSKMYQQYNVSNICNKKEIMLTKNLSGKFYSSDYKKLIKFDDGVLLSILQNDIKNITEYLKYMLNFGYIPLKLIIPLVLMCIINFKFTVAVLIATPFALLPGILIGNKQYSINSRVYDKKDKLNESFLNMLKSIRLIKAYTCENKYEEKNKVILNSYKKNKDELSKNIILYNVINSICGLLPYIFLYLIGAYFVLKQQASIGNIVSMAFFVGILTDGIDYLQNFIYYKKKHTVSIKRYNDIISIGNSKLNGLKVEYDNNKLIEFKDVSFGYEDGSIIFSNMNFAFYNNRSYLLTGENGSGKTTLFKLISKLYDVNSGEIVAYTNNRKNDGKFVVSMANQNPILFSKTIKENIKMANPNLSDEKLYEICKITKLDELIYKDSEVEKSANTVIENFSKGQLQRINLARALAAYADLYLLDEPVSGLEEEIQDEVLTNIINYLNEKALIIISHNKKHEKFFDQVVELKEHKLQLNSSNKEGQVV